MTTPLDYMTLALQLAERGRLTVSPNPMVGCIIVKDKQIIGQGFHQRAGEAHAEIHALQEAGSNAQEATMYVTLEPCCHIGKTPPCTDAIIKANIKKIFIATLDPNILVAGKGAEALRQAGIEVKVGLCENEAKQLNEIFFHYITTKRPFVIAKWAMSLDGKTITHPADSRDISGTEACIATHTLRQQVDAILVGANTALKDDPQLTVRLSHEAIKHPIRVILSTRGQLPLTLKIFDKHMPSKTILVVTEEIDETTLAKLRDLPIDILTVKQKDNLINLEHLLDELGKRDITSLLVEGGMRIHESFIKENLVNKFQVYIAPVIIGTLEKKQILSDIHLEHMSPDYCFSAKGNNYV